MRAYERVELTNMCMVCDDQGRTVMVHRHGSWPGYAFPGGHVEPGESMVNSVIREVREETGLTVEHPRLCGVKDWIQEDGSRYMVLLYRADSFTGELASSEEGETSWQPIDRLEELPLAKGLLRSLPLFLDAGCSEQWFDAAGNYSEKVL